MPIPSHIKQIAYGLDPECWESYSGKPVEFKRMREVRRQYSLLYAHQIYLSKLKGPAMSHGNDVYAALAAAILSDPTPGMFGGGLHRGGLIPHARYGLPTFVIEIEEEEPEPPRYHSSNMKIAMMLHFAASIRPFSPESQRTSQAYVKFVKQLLRDGLIERPSKQQRLDHPGWAYKATDKGKAYVEALKDVQLPVPTTSWSIPE